MKANLDSIYWITLRLNSFDKGFQPISVKGTGHLQLNDTLHFLDVLQVELNKDKVEQLVLPRKLGVRDGPLLRAGAMDSDGPG